MCSKKHQKEAMNILQDMASMPNETDVSKLTKKIVFDGSNPSRSLLFCSQKLQRLL